MTDPLDFDGLVDLAQRAIPDTERAKRFVIARAVLRAVLPHVLAGPREALALVAVTYPEEHLAVTRARAELARIDKLTEGAGT